LAAGEDGGVNGELATMALQVAATTVLASLAGVGFVWAICWWADRRDGR
jgi:hypothetical protein